MLEPEAFAAITARAVHNLAMSDSLASLDPPDREVARAIEGGAWAASCSVYERDGGIAPTASTDADVMATVTFVAPSETFEREWQCSLGAVLALAAGGARINRVTSPDSDALTWTAVAIFDTRWVLPPIPVRLRPVVPGQLWLVVCYDRRGLSMLPYSDIRMSVLDYRRLGDAVTNALTRTSIPGLRSRIELERRELRDDLPGSIASAATEILSSSEAEAGADGGLATLEWEIRRLDLPANDWSVVASSPMGSSVGAPTSRRSRLNAEVQRQMQEDAFGTGVSSPRSRWRSTSLDWPVDRSESAPLVESRLIGDPDVRASLELDDLLADADLTARELRVFELQFVDGLKQVEIAERLGIAPGTVAVLSSRAAKKVRKKLTAT